MGKFNQLHSAGNVTGSKLEMGSQSSVQYGRRLTGGYDPYARRTMRRKGSYGRRNLGGYDPNGGRAMESNVTYRRRIMGSSIPSGRRLIGNGRRTMSYPSYPTFYPYKNYQNTDSDMVSTQEAKDVVNSVIGMAVQAQDQSGLRRRSYGYGVMGNMMQSQTVG